jgi:hypothetical protein
LRLADTLTRVVSGPEHYLLGRFVVHLLGQDAGFPGSTTPTFWIIETRLLYPVHVASSPSFLVAC